MRRIMPGSDRLIIDAICSTQIMLHTEPLALVRSLAVKSICAALNRIVLPLVLYYLGKVDT